MLSRLILLWGDLKADSELIGGTMVPLWLGDSLGSPRGAVKCLWGDAYLGFLSKSVAFSTKPQTSSQKLIERWRYSACRWQSSSTSIKCLNTDKLTGTLVVLNLRVHYQNTINVQNQICLIVTVNVKWLDSKRLIFNKVTRRQSSLDEQSGNSSFQMIS